ncbi:MAG: 50S ribosomal protein L6 [Zavarzinella sp.]
MSRIGRLPISIPAGVTVTINERTITIKGAKGTLTMEHHPGIQVKHDSAKNEIVVIRPDEDRLSRSLHGLTRTLVQNMVVGVTSGYEKRLKIEGLGYQARMDAQSIVLSVGYANQIKLTPEPGVTVSVLDKEGTQILVTGIDKQKVGQFAADIRAVRKPEPYKGKGIRYQNEEVRRKDGKSFASGG